MDASSRTKIIREMSSGEHTRMGEELTKTANQSSVDQNSLYRRSRGASPKLKRLTYIGESPSGCTIIRGHIVSHEPFRVGIDEADCPFKT